MPGILSNSMVAFGGRGLLIDYLIVGGGGGGQAGQQFLTDAGAGGGAQVLFGSIRLRRGINLGILVGLAGSAGSSTIPGQVGGDGGVSSIATIGTTAVALGGGHNGSGVPTYGWGGSFGNAPGQPGSGPSFDGGAGKAGGAGAGAGGNGVGITPGPGIISSITGAPIEYGRGGLPASNGGDIVLSPPGRGGAGGKGNTLQTSGFAGVAGVCIVRYPGLIQKIVGGNSVTQLSGFIIHTWTSNGNLVTT